VKTNIVAALMLLLAGCSVLDGLAGIRPDGTTVDGPSVVDTATEAAKGLLGPYGAILGLAVGWAVRERKHHLLIAAGKKDANRDGVEDPPSPAAPA
jgi:hypothetical protein